MLRLPKSTEIAKLLPKKAIYDKFGLKAAQRDCFDADISHLTLVNVVSPATVPALKEGERIKEFYVLQVALKQEHYDEKNILLLSKLIKQNMIFGLVYQDRVRVAVVHERMFASGWQPLADATLPLNGMDMDSVWEHIVMAIGHFEVAEGVTIEEQIALDGEKQAIQKQIATLEKRCRSEKQPHRRYELYQQIAKLKEKMEGRV